MATLNPIILKERIHADGSHAIRIALRHKSQTAYIVTPINIESLTQFRGGRIVRRSDAPTLNVKLQDLLNIYQDRLDSIGSQEVYTVQQLKRMIEKDADAIGNTFSAAYEYYLDLLRKEGRDSYATTLERSCRYFVEHLKGDILLKDITGSLLEGFARALKKRGVKPSSVSTFLAHIKAVINRAVKNELVEYKVHPFSNIKLAKAPVRKVDISLSDFQKIQEYKPYIRKQIVTRDLFLLSFYLGGMNLVDIMQTDFRGSSIEYIRSKSAGRRNDEETVGITLPVEAKRIIRKWINKRTGRLEFGYSYKNYHNFAQYISLVIHEVAREAGVKNYVSFYSARKTFAQFASDLGVPDAVIDYCLGHSSGSRGIIRYYTHVRREQADIAINRVIDYVSHPDKYKEYLEMRKNIMMMQA